MAVRGKWLCLAVVMLAVTPASASAATLTVNTTADEFTPGDGLCSLREAVGAVNSPGTAGDCGKASSGANTIVLGPHRYPLKLGTILFRGPPPSGCYASALPAENDNFRDALSVLGNVHDLTIEGAGPASTIIDACKLGDRVLDVAGGAQVTLRGLTLTNGRARRGQLGNDAPGDGLPGGPGTAGTNGGGILNAGTLTLIDSAVTNSAAGAGGGGAAGGFAGGKGGDGGAGGLGGGIYNSGTLSLIGTTITGNAGGHGGDGGDGTVGNSANTTTNGNGGAGGAGSTFGDGGGVASVGQLFIFKGHVIHSGGNLTVSGSTIAHNHAGSGGNGGTGKNADSSQGNGGNGGNGGSGAWGGGISIVSGSLNITNSTVAENNGGTGGKGGPGGTAANDLFQGGNGGNGGPGGNGGGLRVSNPDASPLADMTVADNAVGTGETGGAGGPGNGTDGTNGADGVGGGIYASNTAPAVQNAILASNGGGGNCSGPITDGGHNLSYLPTTIGPLVPHCPLTFQGGNPKLGPLQDNFGPTMTMALQAGSAAIDAVPATGAACPATDQRNFKRPSGPACDIGAYELTPPAVSTAPANKITGSAATLNGKVTAFAPKATVHFEYGKTTAYGKQTAALNVGGITQTAIAAKLKNLKSQTTYHFRVVATSSDGTSTSADATFKTAIAPVITKLKIKLKSGHATLTYRDSQSAKTIFIVRRCTKRATHGGKCKRWVRVFSFIHHDTAGHNEAHFTPPHKSGRYQVIATPKANGITGKAVRVTFRVT